MTVFSQRLSSDYQEILYIYFFIIITTDYMIKYMIFCLSDPA